MNINNDPCCESRVQKCPQAFPNPEIKIIFLLSIRRAHSKSSCFQLRSPVRSVRRVTLWIVPSGS